MGPSRKRVRVSARVRNADGWLEVEAKAAGDGHEPVVGRARVAADGSTIDVEAAGMMVASLGLVVLPHAKHDTVHVFSGGKLSRLLLQVDMLAPDYKSRAAAAKGKGVSVMTSPMPGKVTRVLVKPGDAVAAQQTLLVLEAMKMEHAVRAPRAGVVQQVMVSSGALVGDGVELCSLAE